MSSETDPPPKPLVLAWAVTLVVLLAVTWRLWTPFREGPAVPPLASLASVPGLADCLLLVGVGGNLLSLLFPADRTSRWSIAVATGFLAGLMSLDQLRWQPWAYHALLVGVILASSTVTAAVLRLRWLTIAVYAFSAIAKLDAEFTATLGSQMLGVIGVSAGLRSQLALGMPIGELALAGLLAASLRWRRLAWPACVVAVAMHATTLVVLGPWGLGHSLGVLLWNVGFASQTVALFRPRPDSGEATESGRPGWLANAALVAGVGLPMLTPLGLWDQWPGWALYAPGGTRATVYVQQTSVSSLPKTLREHVGEPADPMSPWRPLAIDDWVLAETGAPIYPQPRIVAAIAASLGERDGLTGRLLLVRESPANRFTRERRLEEITDPETIAEAAKLGGLRPGVAWDR